MAPEELIARYAPLKRTLQPAQGQGDLAQVLERVGKNVEDFLKYFPNTACSEEVRQEIQKSDLSRKKSTKYQYVIVSVPKSSSLEEYRTDSKGTLIEMGGLSQGFLLTSGFATFPLFLHPVHQGGSRFRYLGTTSEPKAILIAFAQIPGMAKLYHEHWAIPGPKVSIYFQGLIWVDPSTYHVVRMYAELLAPRREAGLDAEKAEVDYEPVSFKGVSQDFWLPREVNITLQSGYWTYRNRHHYSDYKLFTVESYDKVKPPTPPQ